MLGSLSFRTRDGDPGPDWVWIGTVLTAFTMLMAVLLLLLPAIGLWGAGFTLCLLLTRVFLPWGAAVLLACLLAWGLFFSLPRPSIAETRQRLQAYARPDVTSPGPIAPTGDILIEEGLTYRPRSRVQGHECNGLCERLLATHGVDSVTMAVAQPTAFAQFLQGAPLAYSEARTYRLGARKCHTRDWDAAWICDIEERPLNSRYNLVLRFGEWQQFPSERPVRTYAEVHGPAPQYRARKGVTVRYTEMRDGRGQVLFRRLYPTAAALAVPLRLAELASEEDARAYTFVRTPLELRPAPEPLDLVFADLLR